MVNIGNEWDILLKDEFEKDYYKKLRAFLKEEYGSIIGRSFIVICSNHRS